MQQQRHVTYYLAILLATTRDQPLLLPCRLNYHIGCFCRWTPELLLRHTHRGGYALKWLLAGWLDTLIPAALLPDSELAYYMDTLMIKCLKGVLIYRPSRGFSVKINCDRKCQFSIVKGVGIGFIATTSYMSLSHSVSQPFRSAH